MGSEAIHCNCDWQKITISREKINCFKDLLFLQYNNKDSNVMRLFLINESVPKMDLKSKLK